MTSSETQEPRKPDALEQLRAAKGEGWQWPRIQSEPCPQCGFNPASLSPDTLGDVALEKAAGWREFPGTITPSIAVRSKVRSEKSRGRSVLEGECPMTDDR